MQIRTEVAMDGTGSINSFSAGILMFDCTVCTNKVKKRESSGERETAEVGEARERGDGNDGLDIQQEKPGE